MLTAAVEPILEAISIGRTDIIKKLVEEVEAEIKKSNKFENDRERGENGRLLHPMPAVSLVLSAQRAF